MAGRPAEGRSRAVAFDSGPILDLTILRWLANEASGSDDIAPDDTALERRLQGQIAAFRRKCVGSQERRGERPLLKLEDRVSRRALKALLSSPTASPREFLTAASILGELQGFGRKLAEGRDPVLRLPTFWSRLDSTLDTFEIQLSPCPRFGRAGPPIRDIVTLGLVDAELLHLAAQHGAVILTVETDTTDGTLRAAAGERGIEIRAPSELSRFPL